MRNIKMANIFWKVFFAFIVGVSIFGNFVAAQTKSSSKKRQIQKIKQATDKIQYAPDADLLNELQTQVSIAESKKDWKQLSGQRPIINHSGDFSASIAQFAIAPSDDSEAMIDVIVVFDRSSNKFYEIRGFDFPRPFTQLKWLSDDVLQFEQWVNPRNGGRYALNVKTGKIVTAGYLKND